MKVAEGPAGAPDGLMTRLRFAGYAGVRMYIYASDACNRSSA